MNKQKIDAKIKLEKYSSNMDNKATEDKDAVIQAQMTEIVDLCKRFSKSINQIEINQGTIDSFITSQLSKDASINTEYSNIHKAME